MTERLLPTAPGPYRSLETHVRDEWIDVNGHMNAQFFGLVIYDAHARFTDLIGLGDEYVEQTGCGKVVVESHITYERELRRDEAIVVDSWLLGVDDKRAHFFHELRSPASGHRVAVGEQLDLHFDLSARRVASFPDDVRAGLEELSSAQCAAGLPVGTGRTPGVRSPKGATPQDHRL
ncbi:(3S)-malyl-CoA thioesterase [Rhodococcus sp. OK519]|uniref:thioesterase family protein n=1 Tax=Rhodococcus sp. OK519 TaxID=2135729 RepID=UPI000D3C4588|nr:(3S)-malyl-CoA thioesterase [Rhodococcus sp. OK519]